MKFNLVIVEDDSLPALVMVRSRRFSPLLYGVFRNKKGIFVQKIDKKFRELKNKMTPEQFGDNFCSA